VAQIGSEFAVAVAGHTLTAKARVDYYFHMETLLSFLTRNDPAQLSSKSAFQHQSL
jgi:hypothetical protein